jgi:hypothetical protein
MMRRTCDNCALGFTCPLCAEPLPIEVETWDATARGVGELLREALAASSFRLELMSVEGSEVDQLPMF